MIWTISHEPRHDTIKSIPEPPSSYGKTMISDKEKKYMMIDTSQGFHDRLTNILSRSKNQFCDKIDRDHNFAYMLIILGFPMVIFGPLLFMGAASVLNELCDKWELGHLEVNEEYRRDRDNH